MHIKTRASDLWPASGARYGYREALAEVTAELGQTTAARHDRPRRRPSSTPNNVAGLELAAARPHGSQPIGTEAGGREARRFLRVRPVPIGRALGVIHARVRPVPIR
jgi:hypothetical protein